MEVFRINKDHLLRSLEDADLIPLGKEITDLYKKGDDLVLTTEDERLRRTKSKRIKYH